MQDSFWFGVNLGDLLFSGLMVQKVGPFVGTCIFFTCFTIFFEGLKVLETKLRRDHNTRLRKAMQGFCSEDRSNLLANRAIAGPSNSQASPESSNQLHMKFEVMLTRVLLFTTNTGLNYLLMLVVMLYNVYLFISIILGITIGYYLFGHISMKYKMESISEKSKVVTVCVPECDEEGSTPPLLRGSGASESNIPTCEARAQAKRLLKMSDGEPEETCSGSAKEECCNTGETSARKTTDPSKIKSSKTSGESKCCEEAVDKVEVVSEFENDVEKSACCNKPLEEPETVGTCAKNSPKL